MSGYLPAALSPGLVPTVAPTNAPAAAAPAAAADPWAAVGEEVAPAPAASAGPASSQAVDPWAAVGVEVAPSPPAAPSNLAWLAPSATPTTAAGIALGGAPADPKDVKADAAIGEHGRMAGNLFGLGDRFAAGMDSLGDVTAAPMPLDKADATYNKHLADEQGATAAAKAKLGGVGTAEGIAGDTAGAMAALPEALMGGGATLGARLFGSGMGGFALGAVGGAAQSPAGATWEDVAKNAGIQGAQGLAIGAAAPAVAQPVGRLIGAGAQKVSDALYQARYGEALPSNVADPILAGIGQQGQSVADAAARMQQLGPAATLADTGPALEAQANRLANRDVTLLPTIKANLGARSASADDRMAQIVNDTLGPAPDAPAIAGGIEARADAGAPSLQSAQQALDTAMGQSTDPHAMLNTLIQSRSQAAQPLYDKALSQPVAWDGRLQQFLDDPIVQSSLAKGVRLQRLDALEKGVPFDPNDYGITSFNAAGDPVIGPTPNMKTLDVVKKGLDSMVQDATDPLTGRLSQEGNAINGVRKAFLTKLDQINPDYQAARQAWAGPTQTMNAFRRGMDVLSNRAGSSGIDSTPGALQAWMADASDAEQDAARLGTRTAYEQQMVNAGDPAAKAAALANKGANQQKLSILLGDPDAQTLTGSLTAKYTDPVGNAFQKGLNTFQNRGGMAGIEDTPGALKNFLSGASPEEQQSLQQGARQAIEQAVTSARQGDLSAARGMFGKSTANRQKLEMIFPNAGQLFDQLDNQLTMRATDQAVLGGSPTAFRQAADSVIPGFGHEAGAASHGDGHGWLPMSVMAGAELGHSLGSVVGLPEPGMAIGAVAAPALAWGQRQIAAALAASREAQQTGVRAGMADVLTSPGQKTVFDALRSRESAAPMPKIASAGARRLMNALMMQEAGQGVDPAALLRRGQAFLPAFPSTNIEP